MTDGSATVDCNNKPGTAAIYPRTTEWPATGAVEVKVQRSLSTGSGEPFSPLAPGNGVIPSPGPFSPGQAPDLVHNLPMELLQAGWRRFWSQREGREYFYNKLTRESKWEMPLLHGQIDPVSDPLGISSPTPSSSVRRPSVEGTGAGTSHGLKRSAADDVSTLVPFKRPSFAFSPYWDFAIPSNAVIHERSPCLLLPPHPEIEQFRGQLVTKLRQSYQELCQNREGIDAPAESFNRWLIERRVVDKGTEPVLPSNCPTSSVSPAMFREIMNDIPVKLVKPKYSSDARRQLFKYAEAAKRLIDTRGVSSESRKVVMWHADDTYRWLQKQPNASFDDYLERLAFLKRQCQPHVMEAATASVEGISCKVYSLSLDYAAKINEKHLQLLNEFHIEPVRSIAKPSEKRMICYPVHLATPSPNSPHVLHQEQEEMTTVRFKGETQKINTTHFHKLEQLYQLNCRDDPRMEHFLSRVWCLLKRYQTFFGIGQEGCGQQGALPVPVFECLNRVFGVTFECFASPLNCYFKQYCSAFPDTDGFFGSRGLLLDFHPLNGSFEANPPFSEELMDAMVDHFESLLSESNDPLSFIVFIPDWKDPPVEALIRLETSRFKRKQLTVPALEHEYRVGFQHTCPKNELYIKSVHGTMAVFLQNDSGFAKWEPTPERIKELVLAYRPTDPLKPNTRFP